MSYLRCLQSETKISFCYVLKATSVMVSNSYPYNLNAIKAHSYLKLLLSIKYGQQTIAWCFFPWKTGVITVTIARDNNLNESPTQSCSFSTLCADFIESAINAKSSRPDWIIWPLILYFVQLPCWQYKVGNDDLFICKPSLHCFGLRWPRHNKVFSQL